jgi:hypothetical protein
MEVTLTRHGGQPRGSESERSKFDTRQVHMVHFHQLPIGRPQLHIIDGAEKMFGLIHSNPKHGVSDLWNFDPKSSDELSEVPVCHNVDCFLLSSPPSAIDSEVNGPLS